MKIGILTAARTNNNGTDIQAFAMQILFSKFNPDTEVINYICDKLERSHLVLSKLTLGNVIRIPWKIYNNINHRKFREKYIKRSEKTYNKNNIVENDYDVIVVGSDQIWNLDITGNDLSFFLPFDNSKTKKYSYAASIGKTDIREWDKKFNLNKLLKNFSGVSVREICGVSVLADINISARHDLDPILCLEKDDWKKIKLKENTEKDYVLLYMVERNNDAISYAINYAKKNGLQVISISNSIKPIKGIKIKRFVSVENWMTYMKGADLVITDSYHALSFAISQNKDFRLFMLNNNEQSNTRMRCLVNMLNLEHCVGEGENCGMDVVIDWKSVEEKIMNERNHSIEYIKSMIK